ncbi:hypothetical protein ALI144C_09745 [Actinosynnema sp. ALI-1.44]|uniref:hypothetical protein n=1 Tax=Actinosynnema sp. ALI-1.44 TaxID=1933779 RepID=UPI00097C1830|nr:hypothetical protein [Actinosynnema sp. ALI-1.44]ONI86928.1 hypothetical protein ALI144C_09745 [Actinosynnema sp. ALI-1.44]
MDSLAVLASAPIVVTIGVVVCFLALLRFAGNRNSEELEALAKVVKAFADVVRAFLWGRKR